MSCPLPFPRFKFPHDLLLGIIYIIDNIGVCRAEDGSPMLDIGFAGFVLCIFCSIMVYEAPG